MPAPNRCEICGEPTERPVDMCRRCGPSLDRFVEKNEGQLDAVTATAIWAARRARWYAERRAAKNARSAVEREGRKARR